MSNFMSPDDCSFWIHYIESIELVVEAFRKDHSKRMIIYILVFFMTFMTFVFIDFSKI